MQLTTILFLAIQASGLLAATTGPEDFTPDFENSSVPPVSEWGNYTAFAGSDNPLVKRNCWSGSPYGCDAGKQRCWKVCGDQGQWCWTAGGDGGGAWNGCTNWGQCNTDMKCGKNCNKPAECGCGC